MGRYREQRPTRSGSASPGSEPSTASRSPTPAPSGGVSSSTAPCQRRQGKWMGAGGVVRPALKTGPSMTSIQDRPGEKNKKCWGGGGGPKLRGLALAVMQRRRTLAAPSSEASSEGGVEAQRSIPAEATPRIATGCAEARRAEHASGQLHVYGDQACKTGAAGCGCGVQRFLSQKAPRACGARGRRGRGGTP